MRKKFPRPRVLLGDSSRSMLAFLEILLEPQFDVVSSETEAEAIVLTARKLAPDLVILDFSLSFLEGLGAARQLYETLPNTKVVFFSLHEDPIYVRAAFEAGAKGYLVKHLTVDLGHYLGRVLQGERVCWPDGLETQVSRMKDN
ncbi:MAG: response regulator transcription factor [Nitrospira sp.]|uniref:Response regulatory domain-containing protein n=2 Tax=Nitrospira defluvii TaxID=330214 RepID=A0ABM8QC65_9BACT|nr:response regulator transcription factor [Nitrospira defluvii]MCS6328703.1 response regulator transcription factor [Nitrospira sp.]CAE6689287.1 Response regulatory domain-containing protein [Nitrospira defluvii]